MRKDFNHNDFVVQDGLASEEEADALVTSKENSGVYTRHHQTYWAEPPSYPPGASEKSK